MEHLILAVTVGLAAGITPGPLQTLVVTTTLQRGFAGGWRVAIGPLLTDAPIVTLSIAVISQLSAQGLRILGIVGGVIVIAFGLREMWASRHPVGERREVAGSRDLLRGAIVNFTNPHPWVFWAGIGGPAFVAAWRDSVAFGVAFLVVFYGLLIGAKLVLAAIVAAGRRRLDEVWRQRLLFFGGALLVAGGVLLIAGRL